MLHYLTVALRNLLRNRRRSFWTISTIIIAQIAILTYSGYVQEMYWGMREGIINGSTGHIQLYKKGFNKEGKLDPFKYMIEDSNQYTDTIMNLEHVKTITSRVDINGIIASQDKSKIFTGQGVQPEQEKIISTFISIVDGANLSVNDPEGALLGFGLADVLGVNIGDYVTLLSPTKYGGLNAVDIKVRGTIQTGTSAVDDMIVKLPISSVEKLLGAPDVSKIMILLDDTSYTEVVEKKLRQLIKDEGWDLEMKTWVDLAESYWAVVKIYNNIFYFLTIIIVFIIISSIINTMSMSVMERVSEIGTIRSIGMKRRGITKLFLSEGFLLGAIGSVIGIVVAIIIISLVNINGIKTDPPPGQNTGYTMSILVMPATLIYSFLLTTIIALIASISPAIKAGRMKVVDALRYNQ